MEGEEVEKVEKVFSMPLNPNVNCPNCGTSYGYSYDIIGEEDIKCKRCPCVFSYDDGFIEHIINIVENVRSGAHILLTYPVCSGIIKMETVKIHIGEVKQVLFKNNFNKVYYVKLGKSGRRIFFEPRLTVADSVFIPVDVTEKGFTIVSSTQKSSEIQKEVEITYYAQGRDSRVGDIPIWHRFLQDTLDLIRKKEYGMAIVQGIATFDAFFDAFLFKQLKTTRGYDLERIKRILRYTNRRDKLYYYLHYVTGKTFEDSPYDDELEEIAKLRDRIVHPKEYDFNEADLKEEEILEHLEIVLKSIKWVNDTKREL